MHLRVSTESISFLEFDPTCACVVFCRSTVQESIYQAMHTSLWRLGSGLWSLIQLVRVYYSAESTVQKCIYQAMRTSRSRGENFGDLGQRRSKFCQHGGASSVENFQVEITTRKSRTMDRCVWRLTWPCQRKGERGRAVFLGVIDLL